VLRNTAVAIRIRMDEIVGEQVVAFGVGARDVAFASRELREWILIERMRPRSL